MAVYDCKFYNSRYQVIVYVVVYTCTVLNTISKNPERPSKLMTGNPDNLQ